jgi:hypothetical protein
MTNTSPIKLDTISRSITIPVLLSASIPLGNARIDPLPTLPLEMRGIERPRVSYQMNNDVVETSIEFKGECVQFWSSDGDRINSIDDLQDGSEPWPDLDDDAVDALIEWAHAVHDRIDAAVYGVAVQLSMNEHWSKAIVSTVVQDYAPETYDERKYEMDNLIGRFQEDAETAAGLAIKATSARDALIILRKYPEAHEARFTDDTQNTMSLFDDDDIPVAEALPVKWTGDSRMREDILADPHGSYNLRDAANWRPSRF